MGPHFTGPFHGEEEVEVVCWDCLRAGALAESGAWSNEGDFEELRRQIQALQPAMRAKDLDRIVEERTSELMERTPPLVTWTEFPWPARDGDWCRFEREAGRDDLISAARADGMDLLEWFTLRLDRARSVDGTPEELLEMIRPGSLADNRTYHPTGAYLFRSTVTGEAVVVVDRE
jgi:uncharacterized protein CbrC (UPF0167 family)